MLNLNQAIKAETCHGMSLQKLILIFILIVILLTVNQTSFCQVQLTLPEEFQNLSINDRALEKDFDFDVTNDTSQVVQNFALDKTGVILHLSPFPKIKNDSIKLRVFSNFGNEVTTFQFLDGTIFALVDPAQTYFIVQEIKPRCNDLALLLKLDPTTSICPDTEAFKIYDKIMITEDTSFKITLRSPSEFYSLNGSLPENFEQITREDFEGALTQSINIDNLLDIGELCFVGSSKSKTIVNPSKCRFENNNIQTVIKYKDDFSKKIISNKDIKLIFSYLPNLFNNLNHNYLFSISEDIKSSNKPIEINKKSPEQFLLENRNSNIQLNLGQISKQKIKVKRNAFNLSNPILLNKQLNRTTFSIPLSKLEAIIDPFSDLNADSVLTNLSISGNEKGLPNSFNISIDNNILVKNSQEPVTDEATKTRLQSTSQDNLSELQISSYLPEGMFDVVLDRTYTFVEQNIAPSTNEAGKPIEVINNKSKADVTLLKKFTALDFNNTTNKLNLDINKASDVTLNKEFQKQLSLSGFLIPPDFRPIITPPYRATIEVSMTIDLKENNSVKIHYLDLKTKDETPLTNFFKFSFLPEGTYNTVVKFDELNRITIFENAGIVKKPDK